jgi:hypothetical protein
MAKGHGQDSQLPGENGGRRRDHRTEDTEDTGGNGGHGGGRGWAASNRSILVVVLAPASSSAETTKPLGTVDTVLRDFKEPLARPENDNDDENENDFTRVEARGRLGGPQGEGRRR